MSTVHHSAQKPHCDSGYCQLLQADQEDPNKDFADDTEEGDAYAVVAATSLAFFRVDGSDLGIRRVLRYSSVLPTLTGLDIMETIRWCCSAGQMDSVAACMGPCQIPSYQWPC